MKRSVILILLLHGFLLGFNQIQQRASSYKPSLHYDSDRGEFIISQLPQLPKIAGVDLFPYFQFLVITGDGNYQLASTKDSLEFNRDTTSRYRSFPIKYSYPESGEYEVEVYFSPTLTSLWVPSIKQKIRAIKGSPSTQFPKSSDPYKWVTIVTPFGNEFIPGDSLVFPIHVKNIGSESPNGGFLFFACNGKKDQRKTSFPPFKFLESVTHGEVVESDIQTALDKIKNPECIKLIHRLYQEYGYHLKIFRYNSTPISKRDHVVFCQLASDPKLEYFTHKKIKFDFMAVAIPVEGGTFHEKAQIFKVSLIPTNYKI